MVRAARGEWLQVGLRPNPQIGYVGDEIGDEGRAGMQGGFVSQEFVTAGKLGLSRAVALREVSAAEQRLERTRRQVVTTVRMYYYELLAAERIGRACQPAAAGRFAGACKRPNCGSRRSKARRPRCCRARSKPTAPCCSSSRPPIAATPPAAAWPR